MCKIPSHIISLLRYKSERAQKRTANNILDASWIGENFQDEFWRAKGAAWIHRAWDEREIDLSSEAWEPEYFSSNMTFSKFCILGGFHPTAVWGEREGEERRGESGWGMGNGKGKHLNGGGS